MTTREDFIAFLRDRLIPDMKASGTYATANSFEVACKFMEDPDVQEVDDSFEEPPMRTEEEIWERRNRF